MSITSEAELSEAIRSTNRVHIGGGGTRGGGDFSLAKLAGITEYSPEELTITVRAGTSIAEIKTALAKHNQILAFEPMDHRRFLGTKGEPTIGGATALNADGPRRLRYGSIRDAALGLRFVDGRGQILRAGGKVMKNVTGLDLTRLMIGSHGQLGAISEVTLKVLPAPKETISLSFDVEIAKLTQIMGALMRQPFDITGLHWSQGKLYLRIESAETKHILAKITDQFGAGNPVDPKRWRDFRDWAEFADAPDLWRVFLRPSQIESVIKKTDQPYAIACGGSQILMGGAPHSLPKGARAICEKGIRKGERIGGALNAQEKYLTQIRNLFDPQNKFGGHDEN